MKLIVENLVKSKTNTTSKLPHQTHVHSVSYECYSSEKTVKSFGDEFDCIRPQVHFLSLFAISQTCEHRVFRSVT